MAPRAAPPTPLARARARRFWTQEVAADKAGVSVKTWRRAEKGLPVGVLSQERIAQALQESAEDLFAAEVAS
jgi:DNA-binding XRE family transcriptional regulator